MPRRTYCTVSIIHFKSKRGEEVAVGSLWSLIRVERERLRYIESGYVPLRGNKSGTWDRSVEARDDKLAMLHTVWTMWMDMGMGRSSSITATELGRVRAHIADQRDLYRSPTPWRTHVVQTSVYQESHPLALIL